MFALCVKIYGIKRRNKLRKRNLFFYGAESAMKLRAFFFLRIHLYKALFAHTNRIIYLEMKSTRAAKAEK